MKVGRLAAAAAAVAAVAACSSGAAKGPSGTDAANHARVTGAANPTVAPTPSSGTARTPTETSIPTGFDLLLDTGGYVHGSLLQLKDGTPQPLGHLAYPAVGPVTGPGGQRVAYSSAKGIGVLAADGTATATVPNTVGCLVGAWASSTTLAASCPPTAAWPPPTTGTWSVDVIDLATGARQQLAPTLPRAAVRMPSNQAFVAFPRADGIYTVPLPHGKPELLIPAATNVAFSVDDTHIAFVRAAATGAQIIYARSDGSDPRTVGTVTADEGTPVLTFGGTGRTLVYAGSPDDPSNVWEIDLASGRSTRLTTSAAYGDPYRR